MYQHQIHVLGRATTDIELKESKAKKKYTKFSVAVNIKTSEDKEETYYYDVLLFGKRAESVAKLVKKGDLVYVIGKPEYEVYESKKGKTLKYRVSVLTEYWQVIK